MFICTAEDFHPYECGGPPCIHCLRKSTENHDLNKCALCHSMDDEWLEDNVKEINKS